MSLAIVIGNHFCEEIKTQSSAIFFGDVDPKDAMVLSCLYKYEKHSVLFENWVP
jgi:hypothetical protein